LESYEGDRVIPLTRRIGLFVVRRLPLVAIIATLAVIHFTTSPLLWTGDEPRYTLQALGIVVDHRYALRAFELIRKWRSPPFSLRQGSFPLRLTGSRYALDGDINGKSVACLIDTGENMLSISPNLIPMLIRSTATLGRTHFIGRDAAAPVGRVRSLEIAGSRFDDPVVYVDDQLPPNTIGLSGDYLERLRLKLDFRSMMAVVTSKKAYTCERGCVTIDGSGVANGSVSVGGKYFQHCTTADTLVRSVCRSSRYQRSVPRQCMSRLLTAQRKRFRRRSWLAVFQILPWFALKASIRGFR
jgi:hypothetical protein